MAAKSKQPPSTEMNSEQEKTPGNGMLLNIRTCTAIREAIRAIVPYLALMDLSTHTVSQ